MVLLIQRVSTAYSALNNDETFLNGASGFICIIHGNRNDWRCLVGSLGEFARWFRYKMIGSIFSSLRSSTKRLKHSLSHHCYNSFRYKIEFYFFRLTTKKHCSLIAAMFQTILADILDLCSNYDNCLDSLSRDYFWRLLKKSLCYYY